MKKMRYLLILNIMVGMALNAAALDVTTTAGQLHEAVTDVSATTLKVSGTLDARDFRFLAETMPQLSSLDLSDAAIEAYSDPEAALLSSVTEYATNVLPQAAFAGSALSEVTLPPTLTGIGQAAFAGCEQLISIVMPATVTTVGAYAFSHTGLTTIELPATVTFGEGAYARCPQLVSATIHSTHISKDLFKGDDALTTVTIGDEVTTIGEGAFTGCTALTGLGTAGNCIVETIGREAFAQSGITHMDFSTMPLLTSIGAWAFANTPLETATVPATVTQLGEGAFYYADQLTQATLPALSDIPEFAFAGNTHATQPEVLAEGSERIGAYAFYGDSAYTSFLLPSTITFIGNRAMAGMTGLQTFDVLCDVAALGDSVWAGIDQSAVNLDTHRSNDVSDLFEQADQWKDFYVLHDYLLGDANNDTRVNVRDITTTVDYILEREPAVFIFQAADVLTDKLINVRDVTGMVELILDEDYRTVRALPRRGAPSMPTVDDVLAVAGCAIGPRQSGTLSVDLSSTRNYNALQFDLLLPEGMTLTGTRVDGRLSNHVRTVGERDNGYRIVAYSAGNDGIAVGNGTVMQLDVQTDATLQSGSYITLENIIFADLDSDYAAAPSTTYIDNVTGIDDTTLGPASKAWGGHGEIVIESSAAGNAQVIAMSGIARDVAVTAGTTTVEAQPGIYIVVIAGKSHKVAVK